VIIDGCVGSKAKDMKTKGSPKKEKKDRRNQLIRIKKGD